MADEQAQGQEPSAHAAGQASTAPQAEAQAAPAIDYEKQIKELRDENAKARIKNRELQESAGDNKALRDQLAALQVERDQFAAEKEAALKEKDAAQKAVLLTRLAVKAGVDPDVAALLDLGKIDLSDEKKALEVLSKLGTSRQSGNQARPGTIGSTGMTEQELRAHLWGPRATSIFGG